MDEEIINLTDPNQIQVGMYLRLIGNREYWNPDFYQDMVEGQLVVYSSSSIGDVRVVRADGKPTRCPGKIGWLTTYFPDKHQFYRLVSKSALLPTCDRLALIED